MLLATIHFPGNCDEAISFYKEAIGAEVKNIVYSDDESEGPNVMHSVVSIHGTLICMTDGAETRPAGDNFTFLVTEDSADDVRALYGRLLEGGGKEVEALAPVFWASMYGIVEDRFGVNWQVMTPEGLQGDVVGYGG